MIKKKKCSFGVVFYSFFKKIVITLVFQIESMLSFSEIVLTLIWFASHHDVCCLRRHPEYFSNDIFQYLYVILHLYKHLSPSPASKTFKSFHERINCFPPTPLCKQSVPI